MIALWWVTSWSSFHLARFMKSELPIIVLYYVCFFSSIPTASSSTFFFKYYFCKWTCVMFFSPKISITFTGRTLTVFLGSYVHLSGNKSVIEAVRVDIGEQGRLMMLGFQLLASWVLLRCKKRKEKKERIEDCINTDQHLLILRHGDMTRLPTRWV